MHLIMCFAYNKIIHLNIRLCYTCMHDKRELCSTLFSTTHLIRSQNQHPILPVQINNKNEISLLLTPDILYVHLLHHISYTLSQYSPKPIKFHEGINKISIVNFKTSSIILKNTMSMGHRICYENYISFSEETRNMCKNIFPSSLIFIY